MRPDTSPDDIFSCLHRTLNYHFKRVMDGDDAAEKIQIPLNEAEQDMLGNRPIKTMLFLYLGGSKGHLGPFAAIGQEQQNGTVAIKNAYQGAYIKGDLPELIKPGQWFTAKARDIQQDDPVYYTETAKIRRDLGAVPPDLLAEIRYKCDRRNTLSTAPYNGTTYSKEQGFTFDPHNS